MKRRFRSIFSVQILCSATLTILAWIARAIISDLATSKYPKLLPFLWDAVKQAFISIPIFQLLGFLFIVTIPTSFASYQFFRAHKESDSFLEIYDSYLTNLSEHISLPPDEESLKRIVELFFRDLIEAFNEIKSASFFIQDQNHPNYLKIIASNFVDNEDKTALVIQWDSSRVEERGVAGEAFNSQKILVVKLKKMETGYWSSTYPCYIFTLPHRRQYPSHKSIIAIPILTKNNGVTLCLGVACFDSDNPNEFDSDKIQNTLNSLVTHLSIAIKAFIDRNIT